MNEMKINSRTLKFYTGATIAVLVLHGLVGWSLVNLNITMPPVQRLEKTPPVEITLADPIDELSEPVIEEEEASATKITSQSSSRTTNQTRRWTKNSNSPEDSHQSVHFADDGPKNTGPKDTGSKDTGSKDTGSKDTGSKDTGPKDTGPKDTGSKDTGSKDAGSKDAGSKDAGSKDTGSKDTGSKDTGSKDTGSKDTGPTNIGNGPHDFSINQAQWIDKPVFNNIPRKVMTNYRGKTLKVVVMYVFDKQGNVQEFKVLEGSESRALKQYVEEVARKAKVVPFRKDGVEVSGRMIWPISFPIPE